MELIRKLLEFAELKDSPSGEPPPEISGYTCHQVHYHVCLCDEAGLLHVRKISGAGEPYPRYCIDSLTWKGHETLTEMRGH